MSIHDRLEEAGYVDIVQTDTLVSWDSALKSTQRRRPIVTKGLFYAKKDGKCFKIVLAHQYPNRSSELSNSRIVSALEVEPGEYADAIARIGPLHVHSRW